MYPKRVLNVEIKTKHVNNSKRSHKLKIHSRNLIIQESIINVFTCRPSLSGICALYPLVNSIFKKTIYEKHVVATWNVGNQLSICL